MGEYVRRKGRIQCHLLTGIAIMLTVAVLLGLNLTPRYSGEVNFEMGWPISYYKKQYPGEIYIPTSGVVVDSIVAIALIAFVYFVGERRASS